MIKEVKPFEFMNIDRKRERQLMTYLIRFAIKDNLEFESSIGDTSRFVIVTDKTYSVAELHEIQFSFDDSFFKIVKYSSLFQNGWYKECISIGDCLFMYQEDLERLAKDLYIKLLEYNLSNKRIVKLWQKHLNGDKW